jgi:hypothetical protein
VSRRFHLKTDPHSAEKLTHAAGGIILAEIHQQTKKREMIIAEASTDIRYLRVQGQSIQGIAMLYSLSRNTACSDRRGDDLLATAWPERPNTQFVRDGCGSTTLASLENLCSLA